MPRSSGVFEDESASASEIDFLGFPARASGLVPEFGRVGWGFVIVGWNLGADDLPRRFEGSKVSISHHEKVCPTESHPTREAVCPIASPRVCPKAARHSMPTPHRDATSPYAPEAVYPIATPSPQPTPPPSPPCRHASTPPSANRSPGHPRFAQRSLQLSTPIPYLQAQPPRGLSGSASPRRALSNSRRFPGNALRPREEPCPIAADSPAMALSLIHSPR
jgi:hypothetical protein